jgi:large exoprotein involved in heme utilization and adhesion
MLDAGEISSSASGTGHGGSIDINVANLNMTSGAVISFASTGTGDACNINLTIADKLESRNSTITTESTQADGGDITITNRNQWPGGHKFPPGQSQRIAFPPVHYFCGRHRASGR